MAYDNTNKGLLAKNKRKEKDEHPSHTGSLNIDGKEYWLSAWVKEGKEGSKLAGERFFSLSVKPKDGAAPSSRAERQSAPPQDDPEDSIPF